MIDLKNFEVWFITGSQHLYGQETLNRVNENAQKIAAGLDQSPAIPVHVRFKTVLTGSEAIFDLCQEANSTKNCIGLITWMHTFSPAKMWINGLHILHKPFLHLHTQFNRDIPWAEIDMDFMNLNQSAHGGREFGFIGTRLGISRKVVVGFWQEKKVQERIGIWTRVAAARHDAQSLRIARFGDNMREVAVTEGNKVSAQIQFGYSVNGYGVGELAASIEKVGETEINALVAGYKNEYTLDKKAPEDAIRYAAKVELGLRNFLETGGFRAFTTTFEDLHGLKQLPGLAVQRLMQQGYGFGAEGDWKTAALLRSMKVMAAGLPGGTSFMEDYTYHFHPGGHKVLGAHMLEICPSIAEDKPRLETHPLSIGGRDDPPRLVFNVAPGAALNASLIDLGNRFRLIANEVKSVSPDEPLPRLPVARVIWQPEPDLETAAAAWILAGGAHHTCFSQPVSVEYLEDFAEMTGIEFLVIDKKTIMRDFKNQLKWNDLFYKLK